MILRISFTALWLACGLIAAGHIYAFWHAAMPKLFERPISKLVLVLEALVVAALGPAGVLACWLFTYICFGLSPWRFGWKWPFR